MKWNGNQYCNPDLLGILLDLVEKIDEYYHSRSEGFYETSDPKRDQELKEKWEYMKSIRSFPKGLPTDPRGKELNPERHSQSWYDETGTLVLWETKISKICELLILEGCTGEEEQIEYVDNDDPISYSDFHEVGKPKRKFHMCLKCNGKSESETMTDILKPLNDLVNLVNKYHKN